MCGVGWQKFTCCPIWKEAYLFQPICLLSLLPLKDPQNSNYVCAWHISTLNWSLTVSCLFQTRFLPVCFNTMEMCSTWFEKHKIKWNKTEQQQKAKQNKKEVWFRVSWRKHMADPETPNQVAARRVLKNISDTRNVFGNIFILYMFFFFMECFIIHILWTVHKTWRRSSLPGTLVSSDLLKWS